MSPPNSAMPEQLVALRIAAMQASLEALGRFDPVWARVRFLEHFSPECTRHLLVKGRRVGLPEPHRGDQVHWQFTVTNESLLAAVTPVGLLTTQVPTRGCWATTTL